jgi:hypothetical protein
MNKELEKLKKSIQNLSDLSKDPNNYVFEYVADLKNKVDSSREEKKVQIDKMSNAMIKRLEAFQEECYQNIKSQQIQETVAKTEKLVQETQTKMDAWENEVKLLVINESKWAEIHSKTKSLDIELHSAMTGFKVDLLFGRKWIHTNEHFLNFENDFNNQLIEFDKKKTIELKLVNFSKDFNQNKEFRKVNSREYSFDESTQWILQAKKVSNSFDLATFLRVKSKVFPIITDFKFSISNLKDSRKDFSESATYCFNKETEIGYDLLLEIKDIMDPENGYYDIDKDQVTIKAEFYYKAVKRIEQ